MKRVLVPVNGGDRSMRAVEYVIAAYADGVRPEVHLLNVQRAITGDVAQFVGRDDIVGFLHERSAEALRPARERLDAAGIPYQVHEVVGPVAERIVEAADRLACDHIVLSTAARSGFAELLGGSMVLKVLHDTRKPVVLVR